MLAERKIAAANASAGNVFIDPRIGAINRVHDSMRSLMLIKENPDIRNRHFLNMVDYFQTFVEPIDKWENEFLELIIESDSYWKNIWLDQTKSWPNNKWLCNDVKRILEDQVFEVIDDNSSKFFNHLKSGLKLILPPILLKFFRLSKKIFMLYFLFLLSCSNHTFDNFDLFGTWTGANKNSKVTFTFNNDMSCELIFLDTLTNSSMIFNGDFETDMSKNPIPLSIRNISSINYPLHTILNFSNYNKIEVGKFSKKWKLRPISFNRNNTLFLNRKIKHRKD